jgi:hypothetical protein
MDTDTINQVHQEFQASKYDKHKGVRDTIHYNDACIISLVDKVIRLINFTYCAQL